MPITLSLVIPMYNEEKTAGATAETLTGYFGEKFPDGDYEIIFVNDGSRDGCAGIVTSLSLPHVRVEGYPDNRGKGSAVREGILAAEGEYILYTDCDLAYGCETVYGIFRALEGSDRDIMIGSRNLDKEGYAGYTFVRRVMSKAYIKVVSLLAGFSYSDSQCGIKCFRRAAAKDIFSRCRINGFAFDLEALILADKLSCRVGEFPVRILHHNEKNSKVSPLKDAFRMVKDVLRIKKLHRNVGKE